MSDDEIEKIAERRQWCHFQEALHCKRAILWQKSNIIEFYEAYNVLFILLG